VMDNETSKVSIPHWDGKAATYARYKSKFEAIAEVYKLDKALDAIAMRNCSTKTAAGLIEETEESTRTDEQKRGLALYNANKKLCAYYTLGQDSNHGDLALKATATTDLPMGVVYKVFETLDGRYRPKDVSAKIELKMRLESVPFKKAQDYLAAVNEIQAQYDQPLDDEDVMEIMATKVDSVTYCQMIQKEMDETFPSLANLCDKISKLQRIVASGHSSGNSKKEKETSLSSADGGGKRGGKSGKKKCDYCQKPNHVKKDCNARKAALEKQGSCPTCSKDGHLESECWQKHPEKAPKKWRKGGEAGAANVEVMVAAVDGRFERQDFA
ncbi:MAG: hypothetical protein ACO3PH_05305, partial [Pelagibacteraceae bacterium]